MKGTVLDIEDGDLITKIKIQIEPTTVTAVITKDAAQLLDIKKGDKVMAIVKSTEVMVGKE